MSSNKCDNTNLKVINRVGQTLMSMFDLDIRVFGPLWFYTQYGYQRENIMRFVLPKAEK